jgi:CheY-like chemotaxis protein
MPTPSPRRFHILGSLNGFSGRPAYCISHCAFLIFGWDVNNEFTVLLAEDDPNDRRLFRLALRRTQKPIQVYEVADGMEVIQYLKGEDKFANRDKFPFPNLLILDLKMPRMTGLEVLHWLRHKPEFARLCTVMLSGSGLDKDVAEAYRLGVNSYFKKPNDFNHFIKVLNVIFDYWTLTEQSDEHVKHVITFE